MAQFKIFFSWQSDHDKKTSHHFILDSLRIAAKLANKSDAEVLLREGNNWEFEVDHDTKGEVGFVDIFDSIKNKIDKSDHFVADLTPVGRTKAEKALPNPNVMIELGYALRTKSHEQITVVANKEHFSGPQDLPFNIKGRRSPITYDLKAFANTEEIKKERIALAKNLKRDFSSPISNTLVNTDSAESVSAIDDLGKFLLGDEVEIGQKNRSIYRSYKGSSRVYFLPHAPFCFFKIAGAVESHKPVQNRYIDPRKNKVEYHSGSLENSMLLKGANSLTVLDTVFHANKYHPVRVFDIESKTAKIHCVDYSHNKTTDDQIRHGDIASYSPLYNGNFKESYIDIDQVFFSWARCFNIAEKVYEQFSSMKTLSLEAGIYSEGTTGFKYGDNFDQLIGHPKCQIIMGVDLFGGGKLNAFVEVVSKILDDLHIYEAPSADELNKMLDAAQLLT